MTPASDIRQGPAVPPPQNNLRDAADKAVENLAGQSADQLAWLGAESAGEGRWRLRVLGECVEADLGSGRVAAGGRGVSPPWRILLLHYLAARDRPVLGEPCVTFAHLPDGRVYAGNYEGRVIRRLCATAGRDASTLRAAAEALGAAAVEARGDLAYDFDVLGRLRLRLIWYAGDDEFGPSACVLLPSNISSLLCIEDVVVLSERLVSRLSGRRL